MKSKYRFETLAIRQQIERSSYSEHSVPLYLTSSFVFDDAEDMRASFAEEKEKNLYSRFSNPNTSELVDKMVSMEGAEAGYAFATGMAAIFSTFGSLLSQGDHIVACRSVFGSTHTLFTKYLPKWGIDTTYFEADELTSLEDKIKSTTKIIYAETPTNPACDILDLTILNKWAKKYDLLLIIDNCFATPYLQNPISFGADIVLHSATKLLDGQGRVLGGLALGRADLIREIYLFSRNSGPALSPFNAWILSKSLETLSIRIDKHCDNALQLAQTLENNTGLSAVKYPFLPSHPQYDIAKKQMRQGGNMVSIIIKGGLEAGKQFLDALELCSLTANLGDSRTIITHPASTTHSKLSREDREKVGIMDGLVRISVGLEHIEDISEDIINALNTINHVSQTH